MLSTGERAASNVSSRTPTQNSGIPRTQAGGEALRSRNKRRDDAIRRKVEVELTRKKTLGRKSSTANFSNKAPSKKIQKGTVASLRPAPAITVLESAKISQACQLMASKRADAVLVVNDEGLLSGILTDKDIAYKVVAEGLDIRITSVASVMTPNPIFVYDTGARAEALAIMTEKKFRHLPVISEINPDDMYEPEESSEPGAAGMTNVVGLLDITKCVFDRLDDLEKKVTEDNNIIQAMETLERRGNVESSHVTNVKQLHGCPDVGSVISKLDLKDSKDNQIDALPEVTIRASVRDAAKIMKSRHHTAVLIVNPSLDGRDDKLGGIFTTKDIVLRVIAAGLDPQTTSVVRVMTPHPDSVSVETSILDALKKLHIGHYNNMPVLSGTIPVGLVNLQQLTMAMLTYLASKDHGSNSELNVVSGIESGPMWSKFWNSTLQGKEESESDHHSVTVSEDYTANSNSPIKGDGFRSPRSPRSVRSRTFDQASLCISTNMPAPPSNNLPEIQEGTYPFKIKDLETDRHYRLTTSYVDFNDFFNAIKSKIIDFNEKERENTNKFYYEDDEGDMVFVENTRDLEEAVNVAKRCSWGRVVLFLGNGVFNKVSVTGKVVHDEPVQVFDKNNGFMDFLRSAPLPVNVALSASIIVMAAFVINRITH